MEGSRLGHGRNPAVPRSRYVAPTGGLVVARRRCHSSININFFNGVNVNDDIFIDINFDNFNVNFINVNFNINDDSFIDDIIEKIGCFFECPCPGHRRRSCSPTDDDDIENAGSSEYSARSTGNEDR